MSAGESRRGERRVMRIQLLIAKNGHAGMRLTEIAKSVGESLPNCLHTLTVMAEEGFAERIPGKEDFWRLAPRGIAIWRGYEAHRARAQTEIDSFHQRVTRDL